MIWLIEYLIIDLVQISCRSTAVILLELKIRGAQCSINQPGVAKIANRPNCAKDFLKRRFGKPSGKGSLGVGKICSISALDCVR